MSIRWPSHLLTYAASRRIHLCASETISDFYPCNPAQIATFINYNKNESLKNVIPAIPNHRPCVSALVSSQLVMGPGPQTTRREAVPQAVTGRCGHMAPPSAPSRFPAPSPRQGCAWRGKHRHRPHLSLRVYFEFIFPLTYFPFSLGLKTTL